MDEPCNHTKPIYPLPGAPGLANKSRHPEHKILLYIGSSFLVVSHKISVRDKARYGNSWLNYHIRRGT